MEDDVLLTRRKTYGIEEGSIVIDVIQVDPQVNLSTQHRRSHPPLVTSLDVDLVEFEPIGQVTVERLEGKVVISHFQ